MTDFDDHERQRWAGRASAYERSFAPLCAHPAGPLLDAAGVAAGDRVLDIGTGTGTVAALAAARGGQVVAIDAAPSMVDAARRRLPGVPVLRAALPELPFAAGRFDVAVANFVLNHVGDPAAALAAARRVVRPGGRVAVTIWPTPAPRAQQLWGEILDAAGADRPPVPRLAAALDFPRTAAGLAGLLRDAGLTGVRCTEPAWTHRTDPEDWWSGPANGVATPGLVLEHQPQHRIAGIRAVFDRLTAPFRDSGGRLALPTSALLAVGTV